ncbi:MAG: hypothetical protein ABL932_05250 [Terricaulis sp.]
MAKIEGAFGALGSLRYKAARVYSQQQSRSFITGIGDLCLMS